MRTQPDTLDLDASRTLVNASHQLGLQIKPSTDRPGAFDINVDGHWTRLTVRGATLIDAARAATIAASATPPGTAPLVVGDRILGAARPVLDAAGWSWLDRRGRLHMRAPGLVIDVDIEPDPRPKPSRPPNAALAASGVQEVAAALLLAPDEPLGVRSIARTSGFAPSTISRSLSALRAVGLVRGDGRPVSPDLFWALAEHWRPEWIALVSPISSTDPRLASTSAHLGDLGLDGFAVGDTRGAIAWNAPVVASTDVAPAIYVPDRRSRDRVVDTWGRASGPSIAATDRVAIAPVHAVTAHRFRRPGESWPVVHPLFVALDLAADRARGHQVLDEWTPEDTARVW